MEKVCKCHCPHIGRCECGKVVLETELFGHWNERLLCESCYDSLDIHPSDYQG